VSEEEFVVDAPAMFLRFTFDGYVGGTLDVRDLTLRNVSTRETIPNDSLRLVFDRQDNAIVTAPGYRSGILPDGHYVATLSASGITDDAGRPLDGDADGKAGGDHTYAFFFMAGDLDRNARVDFNDLAILAQNYNKGGTVFTTGDSSYDGVTDFNDLAVMAQRYNTSLPRPPREGAGAAARPVFSDSAIVASAEPLPAAEVFNAPALRPVPKARPAAARRRPG
jgi:hypothetical protein